MRTRWRVLAIVAALIVCVLAVEHLRNRQAQRERKVEYESALRTYSAALKPGMTRRGVEDYLRMRGNPFQQMCCVGVQRSALADLVRIGKEEAPWYCSEYNVYVAFEFAGDPESHTPVRQAHDSDRLVNVSLFPWLEGCL